MKLSSICRLLPFCTAVFIPVQADTNLTDLTDGDPFFYTSNLNTTKSDKEKVLLGLGRPAKTHSQIPHLPVYYGYMNTNSTYRFVNIVEQVFSMVGEGKHGLWRIQENGTVRMYRKKGADGLARDVNVYADDAAKIIKQNYSSYLPNESWSGYKYPDQKLAEDGKLNFVDLPISHPIFEGKYDDHVPIDLASWYCTMSANDYPYAKKAMDFAFSQQAANEVGPLGKRAGLDVNELYTKVLRLEHFPDARSWVNIGQEGKDATHVKWEAIDREKTRAEYYLVERPFFNKPYLFVTAVYDNVNNKDHQYVRPDGPYYNSIKENGHDVKTTLTQAPRFNLEKGGQAQAVGLPVYGVHHPNRAFYGGGGACPMKGGDWGRYPDITGGSGWPTQYEEVTPLCDAVLVDIKFFTNLDGRTWNDPDKYLANAGVGTKEVSYSIQPGEYGQFSEPYHTKRGIKNPEAQYIPDEVTLTYPSVSEPVKYIEPPVANLVQGMAPTEMSTCRPVMQASLDENYIK